MVLDEKSEKFWGVQGSSIFWWMYSLEVLGCARLMQKYYITTSVVEIKTSGAVILMRKERAHLLMLFKRKNSFLVL
jgi:hypothetical protein